MARLNGGHSLPCKNLASIFAHMPGKSQVPVLLAWKTRPQGDCRLQPTVSVFACPMPNRLISSYTDLLCCCLAPKEQHQIMSYPWMCRM